MKTTIDEFVNEDTNKPVYLITLLAETSEDEKELLRTINGRLAFTSYSSGGTLLQFRIDLTKEPSDYNCISSAAT